MEKNSLELRRRKYCQLSSYLARLDNTNLRALLGRRALGLWGLSYPINVGQSQVFVKRIPVSTLEYENLLTSKNLYDLPLSFNYGIGSPGINVFRQLLAHLKTTHWVLEAAIATFPLMYHYRVLPLAGEAVGVDSNQLQDFFNYWGNHAAIESYMLDKVRAGYELVLFLEYIPQTLDQLLCKKPQRTQPCLHQLCRTIAFLEAGGIIHFDAHFQNVLADDEQIYLTDFGLALDRDFALSEEEETFYDQNLGYDYAEILFNLGHMIVLLYDSCSEDDKCSIRQAYNLQAGLKPHQLRAVLLNHIESIQADGRMPLEQSYVDSIIKYRDIIGLMHTFFADMRRNCRKDTIFPQAKLRSLLQETGFTSQYGIREPKLW